MRVYAVSLLFAAVFLAAPSLQAGYCPGYSSDPSNAVCGTVYKKTAAGTVSPNNSYHVMLCPVSAGSCRSANTVAVHDFYGNVFQEFAITNFGNGSNTYTEFKVYVWSDNEYFGSSAAPVDDNYFSGLGTYGYNIVAPPRPLPPNTIYPNNGNVSVPDHYLVQWYSGIDADRAAYPAHWELYYKYWPFGGSEPANWSLSASNLACHDNGSGPDAQGNCSTYVPGPQAAGNWKWYMRADIDVRSALAYYMPSTIFSTDSAPAAFQQP